MMTRLAPRGWLRGSVLAVLAALAIAGCSASTPVTSATYSYDPAKAAVNVDTAALRQDKAAAHIPDCPASTSDVQPEEGGLPAITLPCLGGGRDVDLAGLRGKPTVVNFWAQTCGPCRQESPLFQKLHSTGQVRVLGVDYYDPLPARAIAFADELGLTYPQAADPEAATRAPLRVSGLPMTVFLASDGTVRHIVFGAVRSASDLSNLVAKYLDVDVELG